jgi:hypothetical protein
VPDASAYWRATFLPLLGRHHSLRGIRRYARFDAAHHGLHLFRAVQVYVGHKPSRRAPIWIGWKDSLKIAVRLRFGIVNKSETYSSQNRFRSDPDVA